jgi:hypothetical protein
LGKRGSEASRLTVSPANVTVDPSFKADRSIVDDAGAEIPERTMLVQAATTDVICAYSVAVQLAGAFPATSAVVAAGITTALDTPPAEEAFAKEVEAAVVLGDAEVEGVTFKATSVAVVFCVAGTSVLFPAMGYGVAVLALRTEV